MAGDPQAQPHGRGARMGAPRGKQQANRSARFDADRKISAAVQLAPGDPLRIKFEKLVKATGVSGAEVLRLALSALPVDQEGRPVGWTPPKGAAMS
ncbi:hypothetical protein [Kitasatospora sp. NPDC057541]|uniref:hypothetical protein n=1 Tax=unclassified Kitasatospora TaxID=2633591 RepID=UPI0036784731